MEKSTSFLLDPKHWTLPTPERVLAVLQSLQNGKSPTETKHHRRLHVLSSAISPVDFYAYLKSRFGPPNGFAMTLRNPSVDNLIHWQYTLECPETVFDITELNMRTEILSHSADISTSDSAKLDAKIQAEIDSNRAAVLQEKKTFEHWHLFLNPYKRLSIIVNRCELRLRNIKIPEVQTPPPIATRAQIERFQQELNSATQLYQEAMELCVTLDMVVPVMGEAAVNLLMLILSKPEISHDQRMREDFSRRPIDVRIKSLPLVCGGFKDSITGSEDQFKTFLRIMNQRNDRLHGNVDPKASIGEEILFDYRTIPLVKSRRTFGELALENALSSLSPADTLENVGAVRKFVEFLLSRLEPNVRDIVERTMEELHLGYRTETGRVGVILPSTPVDIFIPSNEDEKQSK